MTTPVSLTPLVCLRCQTPIPAQPDEIAWVCDPCKQGQLLTEEHGLQALEVQFMANIPAAGRGRPFWVAQGRVTMGERRTYHGDQSRDSQAFWSALRIFYVPAYALSLDAFINLGTQMLLQPPALAGGGSPTAFLPVTVLPEEVRPLAEFIVLGLEADRKDKLRSLEFQLQHSEAQLWILP